MAPAHVRNCSAICAYPSRLCLALFPIRRSLRGRLVGKDHCIQRMLVVPRCDMAHSPAELHRQSEALLAHAEYVRSDAEQARRNAVRCRENANATRVAAELCRAHSNAAQDRQDSR
jgi:hypothetical protein